MYHKILKYLQPASRDKALVCIGHSHSVALMRAAESGAFPLDTINFWDNPEPWLEEATVTRLRPELAKRLQQGELVLSVIGGSAHTVLGMVEHSRPFDFVLPSAPELPVDETRDLIPAEAVRAKLVEMSAEYLDKIPIIIEAAKGPVIHIEPPPPLADAQVIAAMVPWDLFPGQPRRIAPKWLRYKLWRMHSEVIAATCMRLGIDYMHAPEEAKDDEGFLRPCYDQDGAHANAAYGTLVLKAVQRVR